MSDKEIEPYENIEDIPEETLRMIDSGMQALEKENPGKLVNTPNMEEDFPGLFDDNGISENE